MPRAPWLLLLLPLLAGSRHVEREDEGLKRTDRVVGGTEVPSGRVRWVASLQYRRRSNHFCGGTIISDLWVLTAAHCMLHTTKESFQIVTGGTDLDAADLTVRFPEKIVIADYNDAEKYNDLALIKASAPLLPSVRTTGQALRLAMAPPSPSAVCAVLGWGLTHYSGSTVRRLQTAPVQMQSLEQCRQAYSGTGYTIYASMLCAGGGAQDACQGDSGGPLVCRADGGATFADRVDDPQDLVLAGAVSWGIRCATPGKPGVYANVASLADWVREVIED